MTAWEELLQKKDNPEGMVTLYTCMNGLQLNEGNQSFFAWLNPSDKETEYRFEVYCEDLLPSSDGDIEVQSDAVLSNIVQVMGAKI